VKVLLALALLAPQDVETYALREAKELEEFRGGFEGGALILIVLVIGGLIFTAAAGCDRCDRGEVELLPPWEGPDGPRP
jgi:hypothetical protein